MLDLSAPAVSHDRRRSVRWPSDKPIDWRRAGGRAVHHSRLTERSLNGLVMLVDAPDSPDAAVDAHLEPADPATGDRHGFRDAIVRRLAPDPAGRHTLVYLEILA